MHTDRRRTVPQWVKQQRRIARHQRLNSPLTRINKQLKAQGVPYQLVRGRGYYYLRMLDGAKGLPASSIYTYDLTSPTDYPYAASAVRALLAAGGIEVTFTK